MKLEILILFVYAHFPFYLILFFILLQSNIGDTFFFFGIETGWKFSTNTFNKTKHLSITRKFNPFKEIIDSLVKKNFFDGKKKKNQ